MTTVEKMNGLLDKVKACPDADIHLYWSPMIELFIPSSKAERNECAPAFYQWAEENAGPQSPKFYYAQYLMGSYYVLGEDYEEALPLLAKARKSFDDIGDDDGVEICSLTLGVIYRSLGNFDLALKTLMQPFAYFKQTGRYPMLMAGSCNSLANVNLELHNYQEAFSIFQTGYYTCLRKGVVYFEIYALHGMGKAKMLQDKTEDAKEYFNKALEVAEKNKSRLHIGNAMTELAIFNFRTGNLAEAEELNKRALAIREKENFTGAAVTSSINLGEIYIRQSRWDEALEVLNKGLAQAEQIKVKPKMYKVHLLLSKVYKGKGNIEKSLHHFEIFHELREKVQEEDSARKLTDAKLIFETEQTKKENIIIKKQKQEIENKNHQLQETIDELTLTRVSRKARAITFVIAIALFIIEDFILHFALDMVSNDNYFISLTVKIVIIFSLSPINRAIEHRLLKKVIKKKKQKKEVLSAEMGFKSAVA